MTTLPSPLPELDERDRHEGRYAIYAVNPNAGVDEENLRELACCPTLTGIGSMLAMLREDGGISDETRVGILDRVDRTWLLNPWAKGTL
jgi:hypothetical protein